MARVEVVRDRWPEDHNGAAVWVGKDEELYNEWLDADADDLHDKPKPSFRLPPEDVDRLVINWLRGPVGPAGVPGPMGMSSR